MSDDDDEESYRGVIGAFPYAFRSSDSWLFRSYVILGGLVAILAILLFATSLITLIASTLGASGGSFTFSRAFLMLIALAVVGPILSPVLLVARRHRLGGSSGLYDRALAWGGYVFVLSLYLSLLISAPPELRSSPPDLLAPIIEILYGLPPIVGILPPILAAGLIYYVHNRFADAGRPSEASR